jgi:diguanylate cyclase (GGDEF)-like protein/PAS domain S-box-containing protein
MHSLGPSSRDELFLEHALQRAQLGLWDWNLKTGDCSYSATWAQMLGYQPGELPNTSDLWLTLIHPDDRDAAVASGDRHLAGLTQIIETELRLRHKDGHWVWVLDRGGVIERGQDGEPLRMVGVQTDISKLKATEAALAQVNARFRLAIDASGTGIWHHDIDAKKSFWDSRTREIFGIAEDVEITAELWHGYLHEDDKDSTERAHREPLTTHKVVSVPYRIVRDDGQMRYLESLVQYIPETGSSGVLLGTVRDVTEAHMREAELAWAARHDALTGLANRPAFDAFFQESLSAGDCMPVAVFYIDLDYFKALNDYAGHAAGDQALKAISDAIRSVMPKRGLAARLGGDEFALVVPHCDTVEASQLAECLLGAVRDANLGAYSGTRRIAASIGISFVTDPATTVADALACADDACYAAKAAGRDRASIFTGGGNGETSGLNAARLAADTMDALDDERLVLYGQEIRDLASQSGAGTRIEVLARLTGKDGRNLPPVEFIRAAERFGMAARLDRWILRAAFSRHAAAINASGIKLGVNLSAQTLSDPKLWHFVDELIDETGVQPEGIVFEITETAVVTNFSAAEQFIANARQRRCQVSLDDFGAGMSSFEYLRRFKVDSIKIDGSFVQRMAESRYDREIVAAIVVIAHSLGYTVVAEKIEEQATADILRTMEVEFGQGFLFHRPEPLGALLARHRPAASVLPLRRALAG